MEWTTERLAEEVARLRVRRGDSTTIEVKSAANGCPTLGPTLCAFANMPDGGTIILGLDESLGFAPVGLTDVATLEAGVASQARTAVEPSVQCDFVTVEHREEPVLICDVMGLPLQSRPARHGQRAYLRQSDGDYVMSEQEIAQIELLKAQSHRRSHPDRQAVVGASAADLDPDLVATYVSVARGSSRRLSAVTDEEVLTRTGVLLSSGDVTLGGLYALGRYPQQFRPELSITAAVQLPPGSGARTRDLSHMDGPLPELLDEAMEWVSRNTRTHIAYDERGHGMDRAELPMKAVREIVANALVHRSLDAVSDSKRVEMRLLDDRLIITSPGGLWGVSEQQLGKPDGKSAVNVWLYDICKLSRTVDGNRVIEGEGGGIREAVAALRGAGLRPPAFIDAGVRFTVVLSRHTLLEDDDLRWLVALPRADELASEQRAILASMRRGVEWTNSRVRDEFAPMDSVEARRLLQQLVEMGLATTTGTRGTTVYRLTEHVPTDANREQEQLEIYLEPAPEDQVPPEVSLVSNHAEVLWRELSEPQSVADLTTATGLNGRQVRYALTRLRDAGFITMLGKQGARDVTYRRHSHEAHS